MDNNEKKVLAEEEITIKQKEDTENLENVALDDDEIGEVTGGAAGHVGTRRHRRSSIIE